MAAPFHLHLPAHFVEEMFAQAKAELPNECCGVLAGTVAPDRTAQVVRRYPLTNAAASPVEYLSEPRAMFDAERDMRSHGTHIVAVYHSHPTSEAVPSKKDRERNYSPEVVNFIISLKDGTPRLRGWWLTADGAQEAVWEVVNE